ncbi:MAG: hypothetical protein SFY56_12890 [Bacteroidota bacterium]|nr:hypothetical protein [Bacteroidota bacterium]
MEFSVSPGYKDLFQEKCSNPQIFLTEYHSEGILLYLSFLNAQVYLNQEESPVFQNELVFKLTQYWPVAQKKDFEKILTKYQIRFKTEMNIFKSVYITYFISHELKHFKDTGQSVDAFGEYKVLKAYFSYIDQFNTEFTSITSKSKVDASDPLRFQKFNWPFLIRQFDFNEKVDPVYQSICTGLLLDYFFIETKYHKYLESYLKFYNRKSVWQFVFDFIELFKVSFQKNEELNVNYFAIQPSEDFNSILDNFSINVEEYKQNQTLHLDNLGIKKKPLFKSKEGYYIVLNWKFFYNSIYMGTFFDFIEKNNLSYNSFKSILGFEVIEKKFFRPLFRYIFENHKAEIKFSDSEGMPDCYLRIGKYIYLFELKDNLVSTDTISSGSFETIVNHINSAFVKNDRQKNKGISQLISQIDNINKNCYEFDDFVSKGMKKRNIVIIPIIITTSFTYQMPGINKYLNGIMTKNLPTHSFENIYPLTLIDFKFFYRQFMKIRSKEIDIKDLIKHYHKRIKDGQKQFIKRVDFKNEFIANSAFEESLASNDKLHGFPQKEKDFTKGLFEALKVIPENTTLEK